MRPGRTQIGMSSYRRPYISFYAFTRERPDNELKPVWLPLGCWTETRNSRTRSHVSDRSVLKQNVSAINHGLHQLMLEVTWPGQITWQATRKAPQHPVPCVGQSESEPPFAVERRLLHPFPYGLLYASSDPVLFSIEYHHVRVVERLTGFLTV